MERQPLAERDRQPPLTLADGQPVSRREPPVPFRQFVLKLHSRCNLSCDYCYMYEMADQTWRSRPPVMTSETMAQVAQRISEHVQRHRLARVSVVLHGGEPLLAGPGFFDEAATVLRATMPPGTTVDLSVQTNGVLLSEPFLRVLRRNGIRVGISLDGGPGAHDRHRHFPNGRGSHADVTRGIRLLCQPRYQGLFAGLLCTIDLHNDPIETYEALLGFAPPRVDFLLPHGNWTVRPPGRPDDDSTPYADWLIQVFDRWYGVSPQETSVRLFQDIMHLLLGGQSSGDLVGLAPSSLVTIDTDGSIEQVDALRSVQHGAAATGFNVFDHALDLALEHPSVAARQLGFAALCDTCKSCPVCHVCGGGFYPHRYRAGSGFSNPSVYCHDLRRLILHIHGRVRTDLDILRCRPG